MPLFKKKPVVIEAVQYTGENPKEILQFMFPDIEPDATPFSGTIETLEGKMHVSENDWVIKGVNGEFYPCKPDIFEKTYERI